MKAIWNLNMQCRTPIASILGCFALSVGAAFSPLFAQQTSSEFRPTRVLGRQPVITDVPVKSVPEMTGILNPSELVLGVTVGGHSRAYPINMLTGPQREILNDLLGGQAIAATW
jgi:hypothetical protein